MQTIKLYGTDDCGCYADGVLGHDHVRDVLASLMLDIGSSKAMRVHEYLLSQSTDDCAEEDMAIDILQDHTEDGLLWILAAGDLLLVNEADDF